MAADVQQWGKAAGERVDGVDTGEVHIVLLGELSKESQEQHNSQGIPQCRALKDQG